MKIKTSYFNRFFILSTFLSLLLFFVTKNNMFVLVILGINIIYFMTVSILISHLQRLIKNTQENFYSIISHNIVSPIKEINDFTSLIKNFISHEKLIEAVNLTLLKNSDSEIFYKVVVENIGLIFNTPHLTFILYNPIVRKSEIMYSNGYFLTLNNIYDYNLFSEINSNKIIYPSEYSYYFNIDETSVLNNLKNMGIIFLNSTLGYKGYIVFGNTKEEVKDKIFEKYSFMFLEIATSFNSHINNKILKEKIYELHLLNKIINLMETNKDIDEILRLFITHLTAKEGLSFNRAILFNKENNYLTGIKAVGPLTREEAVTKWEAIKNCTIDLFIEQKYTNDEVDQIEKIAKETVLQIVEDPILSDIISTKKTLVLNLKDANFSIENKKSLIKFNLNNFIISPLVSYDNCIGIVLVDNAFDNKYFSEERIESLINVTSQTSLVINNLLLYNKIKNMAIRDELTKLYNRRFFEEQLNLEVERATRHRTSISLIMIDIDYFKNYNDKNGHIAGDTLLSTIAGIFKDTCRSSDYVCRYGGEEFAIILPETDIVGAFEVAEKIRKKVYSNIFPYAENQPNKRITISLGVATFPQLAGDKLDLKEKADKALYTAKKTGRNKAVIYSNELSDAMIYL